MVGSEYAGLVFVGVLIGVAVAFVVLYFVIRLAVFHGERDYMRHGDVKLRKGAPDGQD